MTNRGDMGLFLKSNVKVDDNGCWRWQRRLKTGVTGGYGAIRVKGKTQGVHRLAFLEWNGPIPAGMFVCHQCHVRCCINPLHLYVGTQKENMRDMNEAGRGKQPYGEDVHKAKLKEGHVIQIRKLLTDGHRHIEIAELFGVTKSTVTAINRGKTWKHLV